MLSLRVTGLPVSNRSGSIKRLYWPGVSTFYVSERSEFRMWPGRVKPPYDNLLLRLRVVEQVSCNPCMPE